MEQRRGDWISTFTGRKFRPLDPRPEEIFIEDIAHSLSLQCRFAGHCREFYSVAQHSVLVSNHCDPADRLWGLLHDAAEAYLQDIVRPVKKYLTGYAEAERKVMDAVCERFGLYWSCPDSVERADNILLVTELRDLMTVSLEDWTVKYKAEPLPDKIDFCYPPLIAESQFLKVFRSLTE